jgi:hypothetical protein
LGTCQVEGDCNPGDFCGDGHCYTDECSGSVSCGLYLCSQQTHKCNTSCGTALDCVYGYACDDHVCGGACSGTVKPCDAHPDSTSCASAGCTWTPRVGATCSGSAYTCDSLGSATVCGQQNGCAWNGSNCTGSATGCSLFSTHATCIAQHGCAWLPECTGTVVSCDAHQTPNECTASGCVWQ